MQVDAALRKRKVMESMVEYAQVTSVHQQWTGPTSRPQHTPESPGLVDLFERYFELVPATTPALLDQAFELRYQVYCVENEFEDPASNPDGRERDSYDDHSVHWLLRHKPSGELAGLMRLVLPRPEALDRSFPMQHVCDLEQLRAHYPDFHLGRAAELSRACIARRFRRRIGETFFPGLSSGQPHSGQPTPIRERRVMPHITLGLMKATAQVALDHGIDHLVSIMDPALLRLQNRNGVDWQPFGPVVDYHGRRLPCHGRLSDLMVNLRYHNPSFADFVSNGREIPE